MTVRRWSPWAVALLLAAAYSTVAVRNHRQQRTGGFDLGIFEQAVRSYAEGHPGLVEIKGPAFPQLGDHFSPILIVLAPVYRIFPSAYTLLIAQAVLLAVAVVPLMRFAGSPAAALVVGLGYGLSWGIAQAVGFDFHEVCFAVPAIASGICALGRRRLREAAAWALVLPLVKEDLGLTTAAFGLLIAFYGARRLGLTVAATGVLATVLSVCVLIPAFNPHHRYDYAEAGGGLASATHQLTTGLITSPVKLITLLMLLAPTAFVALRSPLLLVAVPSLALRFASPNHAYWGTGYHYSAVLMPILFAAFADGLGRCRARGFLLLASLAVTLALVPRFPLGDLSFRTRDGVPAARMMLAEIPDGATVSASNHLAPQLTSRDTVTVFGYPGNPPDPEWIVVNVAVPQDWPETYDQRQQWIADARANGYRTVLEQDGYLLLRHP